MLDNAIQRARETLPIVPWLDGRMHFTEEGREGRREGVHQKRGAGRAYIAITK